MIGIIAGLLPILAPFVVQFMKWFGFKEQQIASFQAFVKDIQIQEAKSPLPADQDAAAEAKLKARIEAEGKKVP